MTIYKKLNKEEVEKFTKDYYNRMSKKDLLEKYQISTWGYSVIRRNIPKRKRQTSRDGLIPLDERYFENIDTPNKAYWLGFIAADGCIKIRKESNTYILSIGLAEKDIGHLEKFKKELKYEGKIVLEPKYYEKTQKYYNIACLRISRTVLCEDLINQGIGRNKSVNLQLPNLSDNLMQHYLRGLIDGDGTWFVTKQGQLTFGFISSIEDFALDVKKYLKNKCELKNDPKLIFHNNAYAFTYSGNIQTRRIFEYLYSNCETYLDRKYQLCIEHFKNLLDFEDYDIAITNEEFLELFIEDINND